MAKITLNNTLLLLLFLSAIAISITEVSARGAIVGGKTEIKDVKNNKEIQQLGSYCVAEHNKSLKGNRLLSFSQVIKAEQQVVAGIKYYLRIAASSAGGTAQTFDAVVVVKPWLKSKELLSFSPSSPKH